MRLEPRGLARPIVFRLRSNTDVFVLKKTSRALCKGVVVAQYLVHTLS